MADATTGYVDNEESVNRQIPGAPKIVRAAASLGGDAVDWVKGLAGQVVKDYGTWGGLSRAVNRDANKIRAVAGVEPRANESLSAAAQGVLDRQFPAAKSPAATAIGQAAGAAAYPEYKFDPLATPDRSPYAPGQAPPTPAQRRVPAPTTRPAATLGPPPPPAAPPVAAGSSVSLTGRAQQMLGAAGEANKQAEATAAQTLAKTAAEKKEQEFAVDIEKNKYYVDPKTGSVDKGRYSEQYMNHVKTIAEKADVPVADLQYLPGFDAKNFINSNGDVDKEKVNEFYLRETTKLLNDPNKPEYYAQKLEEFKQTPEEKQAMRGAIVNVPVQRSRWGGYQPGALKEAKELESQAMSGFEADQRKRFDALVQGNVKKVAEMDKVKAEKDTASALEVGKAADRQKDLAVATGHDTAATLGHNLTRESSKEQTAAFDRRTSVEATTAANELTSKAGIANVQAKAQVDAAIAAANGHVEAIREQAKQGKQMSPEEKATRREQAANVDKMIGTREQKAAARHAKLVSFDRVVAREEVDPSTWRELKAPDGRIIARGTSKATGKQVDYYLGEE